MGRGARGSSRTRRMGSLRKMMWRNGRQTESLMVVMLMEAVVERR